MTAEATVCVVDDNVGVRKSLRALPESAGLAAAMNVSGPAVEGHRRLVLAMMEEAES